MQACCVNAENTNMKSQQQHDDSLQISTLKQMLTAYFDAENSEIAVPNSAVLTGLTSELTETKMQHFLQLNCESDIQDTFQPLDKHYIIRIWQIVRFVKLVEESLVQAVCIHSQTCLLVI